MNQAGECVREWKERCLTMSDLPHSKLIQILDYDPETGIFTWKFRPMEDFPHSKEWKRWNTRYAGKRAGMLHHSGYRHIDVFKKFYSEHRLAWFYVNGKWPQNDIDHEAGIRSDNRVSGFRDVPELINGKNAAMPITNKSGRIGVCWHKASGKWMAQITDNGKKIYLGVYASIADAFAVLAEAEIQYGYHQNHGRKRTC